MIKNQIWEVYYEIRFKSDNFKKFYMLPNNQLKVNLNISQNVLDTSEFFNDNKILVVTDFDSLEETINFNNLPKIDIIILSIIWRNSYI